MAELVDALVSGTSGATLGSSSLLIRTILKQAGVVAQLVERCVRNAEVVGSNPISSTKFVRKPFMMVDLVLWRNGRR